MRLHYLWLGDYQNLHNVEIHFYNGSGDDPASIYGAASIRFFVGLNGSGKSNAIEAIGLIFSHLAANLVPSMAFEIEYELRGRIVRVSNRASEPGELFIPNFGAAVQVRQATEPVWTEAHYQSSWSSTGAGILPDRVVGYATGPTSGLRWALMHSVERQIRKRLGPDLAQTKPVGMSFADWERHSATLRQEGVGELGQRISSASTVFVGSEDALCAVLPLLAMRTSPDMDPAYPTLREQILQRIGLDSDEPLGAFTLHVAADWRVRLEDERQGIMQDLLQRASAIAPIATPRANEDDGSDFYAVFDIGETLTLTDMFPRPDFFFENLLAWKRQGALKRIRLVVKKAGIVSMLPETALSDGEYLLAGRYATLLMLRAFPECLVLLDEPETHFNDRWKIDLVKDVASLMNVQARPGSHEYKSDVVIATHSDLTLTDAEYSQIYLFRRGADVEVDGMVVPQVTVEPAPQVVFAANPGDVSRSLFETGASIGSFAQNHIETLLVESNRDKIATQIQKTAPGYFRFRLEARLGQIDAGS